MNKNDPLFKGGQGRTDSSVEEIANGLFNGIVYTLCLAFCVAVWFLLISLI